MRKIFESELQAVGDDLTKMSLLVKEAMQQASTALLNGDLPLAQKVIDEDRFIDELERNLDERCILLLAQQQPVATDLRVVVSALRISASLERMGDLARHIASVARRSFPKNAVATPLAPTFEAMSAAAMRVANRTHTLLASHDLEVGSNIQRDDDLLDDLHNTVFVSILSDDWEGTAQQTVDLTLLSRYFERFGDHAVSIAQRMSFLVTGDFDEAQVS
ncbi:phosphate signaling complex protein PhoU [Jonesiaceae bacterium BS-20]|uniref:Phosphate-specific transport system accessory protein PhoU n=1 Tax=Jonesiaceae bacterium BS-20 TaxID=3120821 RepID=A0AAU7DWQ8_9MICO